jgi:hypothetical protein
MQAIELHTTTESLSLSFLADVATTRNVPDAEILPFAESDGVVSSTNKSSLPINDTCPSHNLVSVLTPPERGLYVQMQVWAWVC